ncbi:MULTISPECIES: nucleotide pyrophosphohydrolase [Enterococcus]|uniref:Nucleotide pyrophosphohydrolase n=1 Tax=Enterococcus alishanensis TaxID=1303817 RepID=A0ABS6TAT4_9ENTE|nr:nucleotide pyrophosphohydrolase [Enterococcus alishanensis]MBV7390014.1 nucleotide pyrophosphohydrolase [Enterococcus alishanensis]
MEQKTLAKMQIEVDQYIQQFKTGYFSPLAQMARLTEEVGELAREINHYYGEKPKKDTEAIISVEEELGDVLFVTLIMANSLDIDLTKSFNQNMAKFNQRDAYRFERKDGQTGETK